MAYYLNADLRWRLQPVYIDLQTGFYSFPPNKDNIVKFAYHHRGFLNEQPSLSNPSVQTSVPRTGHFEGSLEEQIPAASLRALRAEMRRIWPELGAKPILTTRMCWYADSNDCDFVLSYHDGYPSLFLATGDSGHAFKVCRRPHATARVTVLIRVRKFLPTIGDVCVRAIEGRLEPHLQEAWSYTRQRKEYKPDRGDSVLQHLDLSTLAKPEDLL